MVTPLRLFRMVNELIFVLLGALLLWLAASGRYFFDPRRPGWLVLGAVLDRLGNADLDADGALRDGGGARGGEHSGRIACGGGWADDFAGLDFAAVGGRCAGRGGGNSDLARARERGAIDAQGMRGQA